LLGVILILLFLLFIILSIPAVQSKLAEKVMTSINEDYNTNIVVKKIDLSFLGTVHIKGVEIRDHHQDTLIFVKNLKTSILNVKRIIDNEVDLGDVTLNGGYVYMKRYKEEDDDSMNIFINKFLSDNKKKSTNPFVLKTDNIYLDDVTYKYEDYSKRNSLQFGAYNIGGIAQNFSIEGTNINLNLKELHFTENRGVKVTNFSTDFEYTTAYMKFLNSVLKTDNFSHIVGDVVFNYKREDLSRFTDKVKIKADFKKSVITINDLHKYYYELRGGDVLTFTGKIRGTLNNFSAKNVNLSSRKGMKVRGDMGFVNAINSQRGFLFDADFDNVTSSYSQLKSILPNVLGNTMPSSFSKFGNFKLSGLVKVTPDLINATISLVSEIGTTISDLQLTNISNIDNASYNGEVEFIDVDLGEFTSNSNFGKISLIADVKGSGFKVDNINTTILGTVSNFDFNGYSYKNLNVNGDFQNKKFDGFLEANDENVKLEFTGLADFSSEIHKFDFTTDIDNLDLVKTNLFKRDSIASLKGLIKLDITGNNIDDIVGKANFKNIIYTNSKKTFKFKEFEINSSIKDSIKTINVASKDIVEGKLEGKFIFAELIPVCKNAFGSVYTNYEPIVVSPNQYLNFDFTIYNQIVDAFFPQISISKDTKIKGRINGNKNAIKLNFSSPKLDVYQNIVDNAVFRLDNKNKLYNTHLTADKINTKYYEINKLNLLNRTVNDTLFFKSKFKGGKEQKEDFNLNFFYTINKAHKSVLGLEKSTFNHNDFDWVINPDQDKNNKITYLLKDNVFSFSPFLISSKEQSIEFSGDIIGDGFKDLKSKFTNVQLEGVIPDLETLNLGGILNGVVELKENNGKIEPLANLSVNDVLVNDFSQGILKIKLEGKNSINKYDVDVSLRDYNFDNVKALGSVDFSSDKPTMDLNVNFKEYELNGFSDFGGAVITNLRGRLSGKFKAQGEILNPELTGVLDLEDAGLTFPYLNIDFDLIENAKIDLEDQSFVMSGITLQDTKYDTKGYLSGTIMHQNFQKWYLDLVLNTPNFLVLDTKEVEDVPYYGTGFLRGNATIEGFTSDLDINVNGSTEPGTVFVIPLNDVTTINNYKLIRFKSNKEEVNTNYELDKIKGLNLKIDIEVTKDAIAQIVIDKTSGSDLKGSGSGNLEIEIDTRGKFTMYGDLSIDNGLYNFKYGGVINKPFSVQKGGTISWNGSPFDAELDLTAIYKTKANPAQLLNNINSTRKIDIDLYTKITGGLFDSKQDFDIKIPNANSIVASELEFILNENDINTKIQHYTFLLAFGTFYNEETIGSSASSGLTGTAAQVASNILSNIINTKDSKFQVGLGYTQGDDTSLDQELYIEDQVDVSVSSQLSENVLINGKVGVPVGANVQTSVVGEAKMEVLLNEEGTLRANFFTKPNDIEYSLDEQGYTQGLGLSYQVNFDTFKELREKIMLRKEEKMKKDSILAKGKKNLINFNVKRDTTAIKNEKNN